MRKDKPLFMGVPDKLGHRARGWTPKWKCPKCGTWNSTDTWRCTWCAYRKQSYKEGMQVKTRGSKRGLLKRLRECKPFGELWRGEEKVK